MRIERLTVSIGAEVSAIHLRDAVRDDALFAEIKALLLKHRVLFFRDQDLERFSRADEARSRGGTGLGLAITSAVAAAHGGEAHAANCDDGGADVWLTLPDGLSSTAHGEGGR